VDFAKNAFGPKHIVAMTFRAEPFNILHKPLHDETILCIPQLLVKYGITLILRFLLKNCCGIDFTKMGLLSAEITDEGKPFAKG